MSEESAAPQWGFYAPLADGTWKHGAEIEKIAKKLYTDEMTNNGPLAEVVIANRFPSWEELTHEMRNDWRQRAVAQINFPHDCRGKRPTCIHCSHGAFDKCLYGPTPDGKPRPQPTASNMVITKLAQARALLWQDHPHTQRVPISDAIDAAAEEIRTLRVKLAGAEERGMSMMTAKNEWAERARKAELVPSPIGEDWSQEKHDAYVTRHDDFIRDHEEAIGGVRPKEIMPIQRRAFNAGHKKGMMRAADICMQTTPDRDEVKAIGEAAHYVACAKAIRDEAGK